MRFRQLPFAVITNGSLLDLPEVRRDLAEADLGASGQAQIVQRCGARFWSAAPSHYPNEVHSLAAAPGRYRQRDE